MTRFRDELSWQPSRVDLNEIVASTYAWESRLNAA
jgi:hypothetical protein